MRIGLPICPHYNPNRDTLILLGHFIQALLLREWFIPSHDSTFNTSPNQGTFLLLPTLLNVPLRLEELVLWNLRFYPC